MRNPLPGALSGWTQIFADDFNYSVPLGKFPEEAPKWSAYPNGWEDTDKHGIYNATKTCSVHDGMLDIFPHTEGGIHYCAVPYPLLGSHGNEENGQLHGRYAVSYKADSLPGYKTAWLLWPDSEEWPLDGEIDFPEGGLNANAAAFMHHQGASSGAEADEYKTGAFYANWHEAVIEWTASACRFLFDGKLVGASTALIPNTSMHFVLQTETNGEPTNATEGHVYVDWVSIWH